nr:MAG TPA: hypothetical protein [Caudoviricetes sp.]
MGERAGWLTTEIKRVQVPPATLRLSLVGANGKYMYHLSSIRWQHRVLFL